MSLASQSLLADILIAIGLLLQVKLSVLKLNIALKDFYCQNLIALGKRNIITNVLFLMHLTPYCPGCIGVI